MHRFALFVPLAAGCATPLAERIAERRAESMLGFAKPGQDVHVVLTAGPAPLAWSSHYSSQPGPAALRAAVEPIAGCGQGEHDPLDVRVFVSGEWPWKVRILEATPGAERCLEGVLSELPLDVGLSAGFRYVVSRTTLAALREPLPDEVDPPECKVSKTHFGGMGTLGSGAQIREPGHLALAVTCASAAPVTELTVRYAHGTLVEASTEPPVACVEENARTLLREVSALRATHPNMGSGPGVPTTFDGWEEVICTIAIPLRSS